MAGCSVGVRGAGFEAGVRRCQSSDAGMLPDASAEVDQMGNWIVYGPDAAPVHPVAGGSRRCLWRVGRVSRLHGVQVFCVVFLIFLRPHSTSKLT